MRNGHSILNNVPKFLFFPTPQNMNLFGNRVIADVIGRDDIIPGEGGPLIPYDRCPGKRRDKPCVQERGPCGHGGRDRSGAAASQELPASPRSWKKQGRVL